MSAAVAPCLNSALASTLASNRASSNTLPGQGRSVSVDTHRFGVTHTPTKGWFYCWNDFDVASISQDLDDILQIGCDHIRAILIWPYFQPNVKWVSPAHLERLDRYLALAQNRSLDVQLCMLNGFVSGLRFVPSCLVCSKASAFFKSARVLEAEELFFSEVARVANRHPNFLGFDLANEVPNIWGTGGDTKTGDAWCNRLMNLCERISPGKVHVNGAWGQWFWKDSTFSARFMARRPRVAVMHCYGRYTDLQGGLLTPASIWLPAATAALIRAYAGDSGKPVWCQEYGASEAWAPDVSIAQFIRETTLAGIKGGVNWFTWWSSHDLNPAMAFPSQEYHFGLVSHDHKIKPQGHAFKAVAEAWRGKKVVIPAASAQFSSPPTYPHTMQWVREWITSHAK